VDIVSDRTRDGDETLVRTESPPVPLLLDPRRFPYRADLAAESLYGRVSAPRYVPGKPAQVARPSVPLRRRPVAGQGFDTEALLGERVMVYEVADRWAWVQLERDGYVGYVPAEALTNEVVETTHRVKSIGTFVYPAADIKSPPLMHASLNAELAVVDGDERFSRLAQGGFVVSRHFAEKDRFARDFVDIAERLTGTPYLWGGKTRIGLDCSGLVQVSLHAAGIDCPRDSDLQEAELGTTVLVPEDLEGLQRGDLVFWKGHVGIMVDGLMLLHANAHHMSVVAETLPEAVERIAKAGLEISSIKRLDAASA